MAELHNIHITKHASRRIAQRNLSIDDVSYVLRHGRAQYAANALFVHLGKKDIPEDDRSNDHVTRLEGTVLVFDSSTKTSLATVYRNRQKASRHIRKKC